MTMISRASTPDAERWRIYNKIAWRIMPLILLGYTLAGLDRANVAFAKLQMGSDLGLSDAMYGFGAGIFFVGYCLFEIPSNMILHKVGARLWLARIMIVWGLISAAMMFVTTPAQFYAMRFLVLPGRAALPDLLVPTLRAWPGHIDPAPGHGPVRHRRKPARGDHHAVHG